LVGWKDYNVMFANARIVFTTELDGRAEERWRIYFGPGFLDVRAVPGEWSYPRFGDDDNPWTYGWRGILHPTNPDPSISKWVMIERLDLVSGTVNPRPMRWEVWTTKPYDLQNPDETSVPMPAYLWHKGPSPDVPPKNNDSYVYVGAFDVRWDALVVEK
jgi:hypothetical protein